MEPSQTPKEREPRDKWKRKREKILMAAGLAVIGATFLFAELGLPYHQAFLLVGLALCGISITQLGDRL